MTTSECESKFRAKKCLLDTGGGLKKAAWFFQEDSSRADDPFLVHNVDVLSTIDLHRMVSFHQQQQALATLAVQERDTSRYLLFDEQGQLCGRRAGREHDAEMVRPSAQPQALAFSGVHVISPRLLPLLTEQGVFPLFRVICGSPRRTKKFSLFAPMNFIGVIWVSPRTWRKPRGTPRRASSSFSRGAPVAGVSTCGSARASIPFPPIHESPLSTSNSRYKPRGTGRGPFCGAEGNGELRNKKS